MVIYIGADHRGFNLKEQIKVYLKDQGYEVFDVGAKAYNKDDDYPLFARSVGEKVSADPDNTRGILICGSGIGGDIAVNKFKRVRSGLALSTDQAYAARHDDNINVLSLAADFTDASDIQNIVHVFLVTPFGGDERYKRRLKEIAEIEAEQK